MSTHPGVNPTFDMITFPARDQRVIRRFAQHFYITRAADAVQVGNSNYRAFLMRPADELSVVLNVEREILVLFADYKTFEARTLRAFDLIFGQFDDVRVDRSFRVLVSDDSNIESVIRHFLSQEPEYPIIIPFRYGDFDQTGSEFIFSAVRGNYLIRDLFGYQSPLRQEYFFFGRMPLVEGVIDLHRSGQNSGLFGLRKSGKTSTIFAIQRRSKTAGCRTLVIDCQDPAVHARRFGKLLEYILISIRKQLSLRKIEISLSDSADEISDRFRSLLNTTLNEAGTDVLLIFDEIENISPMTAASRHWREEHDALLFWQILRAVFQNPQKYKITFCFVGTNPHLFEMTKIQGIANPVYLFAPKTFIPMLSLTETREMITRLGYFMGLDFDDAVIGHIHQQFGGHPFFIRQFCSQIHKKIPLQRPRGVSVTLCRQIEQEGGADLRSYFDEILANLKAFYPEEYEMLEYLANGDNRTFSEIADQYPGFVEHLIGYGIIVKRGDEYEFAFNAVWKAVQERIPSVVDRTVEAKRAEASRRRNRIEEEIRNALYWWAHRLPSGQWPLVLGRSLSKTRHQTLGAIGINEAFSRRSSPLNFLELLSFIREAGEFSTAEFEIGQISSAMNTVNKHRIDAHAKDLSDQEYAQLCAALDVLETVFLTPE